MPGSLPNRKHLSSSVRRRGSVAQLGGQPAQGLADSGIQAAHIGIDVAIGNSPSALPDFPTAPAEQISPVYWQLHTTHRDEAERVFSL